MRRVRSTFRRNCSRSGDPGGACLGLFFALSLVLSPVCAKVVLCSKFNLLSREFVLFLQNSFHLALFLNLFSDTSRSAKFSS